MRRRVACALGAVLAVGLSALPVAAASVPDAPGQPVAIAGDAAITVQFVAPGDNGDPITSYTVTCTSSNGGVTGMASGPASPVTVSGVSAGKLYGCSVIAINAAGAGAASPDSATVRPVGKPDPPAQPTVTVANRALVVAFTAPADNGGRIEGYTAVCTSSDGGASGSQFAAGSPIAVTGLTALHAYECHVTATSTVGTGAPSPNSDAIEVVAVPAAPRAPLVARGDALIIVSFSAPANNGAGITGYTATCLASNVGLRGSQSGLTSPITVMGLTNGRAYTCTVAATNAVGTGPSSPRSAATVPGVAPDPPTVVSVVSASTPGPKGALIVSYKPGASNGTPISSYRATCKPTLTGASGSTSGIGSPLSVPGLITGRAYKCIVVAISTSGTSLSSNALTTTVGTPGLPKIKTVTRGGHGLTLAFVTPGNNGQPILRYHAACTSTNGGATNQQFSHTSPITVNGLTPGSIYMCTLTAINARGEGPPTSVGPVRVPY